DPFAVVLGHELRAVVALGRPCGAVAPEVVAAGFGAGARVEERDRGERVAQRLETQVAHGLPFVGANTTDAQHPATLATMLALRRTVSPRPPGTPRRAATRRGPAASWASRCRPAR